MFPLEQYVRDHLCLRTEPATNDVTDYGVKKAVGGARRPPAARNTPSRGQPSHRKVFLRFQG